MKLLFTCARWQEHKCTQAKKAPFQYKYKQNTCIYVVHKLTHAQYTEKASPITLQTKHIVEKMLEWADFCAFTSQEDADPTVQCRSLPTKLRMAVCLVSPKPTSMTDRSMFTIQFGDQAKVHKNVLDECLKRADISRDMQASVTY